MGRLITNQTICIPFHFKLMPKTVNPNMTDKILTWPLNHKTNNLCYISVLKRM